MIKDKRCHIRRGFAADWDTAMELAWRTFEEFNARDYSQEGRDNFMHFVKDDELYRQFALGNYQLLLAEDIGDEDDERPIIGMLLLRENRHISLLFVDGSCHKRGVGHELVKCATDWVSACKKSFYITVNAAPYAKEFYHHEGFEDVEIEKLDNGILYIPMRKKII
ncbi:GNAT family N-acetyltransferase [Butyrivibrio sp. MC2013]|uniref:GNAT family N-acetyltransferase n=1 Tax=Butyrivibrio sp. MC2013 TaxID=1280686 RepID=UPI00041D7093|nr:GNAT family N-acetyltransferase [Butyrivibrio sp. MC2013]